MNIPWYETEGNKESLEAFGKVIQGDHPYHVILEPDLNRCPIGYCDHTAKEIVVNPSIFDVSFNEQYYLTKALIAHEAGHSRFTALGILPESIHVIANVLEDERIERLMCKEFMGIRWFIRKLSERFHLQTIPLSKMSDNTNDVIIYFLRLRWANRIGQPIKGELSPKNTLLWQKIEDLVYEAWQAETSKTVSNNTKMIAKILGVKQ
ncbi:MAG: hypothetical protein PHT33_09505 [bacterium]|nr:hypothetical protein [bacterium]